MFRRRRKTEPRQRVTIGDECEAFLAGTIANLYLAQDLTPPVWAQLNRLARGSFDDLRHLSTMPRQESSRDGDAMWRFMLSRLARELLRRAPTPEKLRRRQQDLLWPLEAELTSTHTQLVSKPGDLYRLVATALDENPVRRTA